MRGKRSELARESTEPATNIEDATIFASRQHRKQTVVFTLLIAVLRQLGTERIVQTGVQLIKGRCNPAFMSQPIEPGVGARGSDPKADVADCHEESWRNCGQCNQFARIVVNQSTSRPAVSAYTLRYKVYVADEQVQYFSAARRGSGTAGADYR